MSNNTPIRITETRRRVLRWLGRGRDDAFLGTESKDELQGKMLGWINRRFANYAAIKELRQTCKPIVESILDQTSNGRMPDRASFLRVFETCESPDELSELLERDRQTTEATYLVQTLRVKHGVRWEDIRPEPKSPVDHMVVGALMALGQQHITMQTLIDLENLHEDHERQRFLIDEALDLFLDLFRRVPDQGSGA